MDEMDELLGEFIAEAQDNLARVRSVIKIYDAKGPDAKAQINDIARGIHTIKGGAGMFNMTELTQRAHKLETFLSQFKEHPTKLSAKHIASVVRFLDIIENLIEAGNSGSAAAAPEPSMPVIDADAQETAKAESEQSSAGEQGEQTQQQAPDLSSQSATKHKAAPDLVRVSIDRIQRNIDAITEIFLTRNQMSHLVDSTLRKSGNIESFLQEWDSLDNAMRKNIGDLEHVAMSMRMMPIKNLFQRMEKTVRTYQEVAKKLIRVQVSGEDTELDKKIVDYLGEPLIHLIRNAMDHGVESPEVRKSKGKDETGTIKLGAEVNGSEVIVTISDDGKGMDADGILAAARKKGLDVSHVQTKEQAINLIFMPGFSTAAAVSETSGRGVGMDAVKTFVEGIGGSIHIQTQVNLGSTFVLHLPLGMSLIPAILATINNQIYAISSSDVIETLRVAPTVVMKNGKDSYLDYKGRPIPCYFVEDYISKKVAQTHALSIIPSRLSICIVRGQEGLVALCVGDFIANTEIAAKALSALTPSIPYVVGASILATGDPVFVLSMRKLHQWLMDSKFTTSKIKEVNDVAA